MQTYAKLAGDILPSFMQRRFGARKSEKKSSEGPEALARAKQWCARAERSERGLRRKLSEWKCPPERHDAIVQAMLDEEFVDEARFAKAFVADHFRLQGWGRVKIRYALRQEGINDALIEAAFEEKIDPNDYVEQLRSLAEKKLGHANFKQVNASERQALTQFLMQRGFEFGQIKELLNG
jgi:regulatory protein